MPSFQTSASAVPGFLPLVSFPAAVQAAAVGAQTPSSPGRRVQPGGGDPGAPAAKAGFIAGMRVLAVNARRFSEDTLRQAIKVTAKEKAKLDLLIENGDEFKTYSVDYQGGEKYPNLERIQDRPDVLSQIIKSAGK